MVQNMRYCQTDNLLHVNVTRVGPNYARFCKTLLLKFRIQYIYMIVGRFVVHLHVVILCAKGQLCSCKMFGDHCYSYA